MLKTSILIGLITGVLGIFNILGVKTFIVDTGSMENTLKVGSIIFTLPKNQYKIQDVVTYKTRLKNIITHRIVGIETINTKEVFILKGDNNSSNDPNKIYASEIIGEVIFSIPFLGYLIRKSILNISLLVYYPTGYLIGFLINKLA